MKLAVYPGSFDPVTIGHLDIIQRASVLFDKVIVLVLQNMNKSTFFSKSERIFFLKETTVNVKNVEIDFFNGLLVDYLKEKNIKFVLKGLRNITDFNYEFNMDIVNKTMYNDFETVFLFSKIENMHISSSSLKEIAFLGGDISSFVPDCLREYIKSKLINKGGIAHDC